MLGQWVMDGLSWTERGFRPGLMQIRFFLAGKSNWEQSWSVVGRGSPPCLALVMPRRVRDDGKSKAFGEKGLIWGFKAVL